MVYIIISHRQGGSVFIMAKLTIQDKKEIIRLYDEEHIGCHTISKRYSVSHSVIERIIRKYHVHGEEVFKKTYNIIPKNTKIEIVKRSIAGESTLSLSIEYLVSESQIRKWVKQYEKSGYNGLENKPKGRPPTVKKETVKQTIDPDDKDAIIKQLQEHNLELQAEVEVLKKLSALVQQRNAQQIKKKQ